MTPQDDVVAFARQRAHRMGATGTVLLVVGCGAGAVAAGLGCGLVVLGCLVVVVIGAALASAGEDLLRRLPR